jgi:tagatose 1,6-diphosphate aldolase
VFGFGFKFLDPGPLDDGELTLVPPSSRYIDDLVRAEVAAGAPDVGLVRRSTEEFLSAHPQGRQRSDRLAGRVPAYHFWMRVAPARGLEVSIVGGIALRVGNNHELETYSGHIGYHVYPPARGHHYAERAARMIFPLAARHKISPLWITCNPDNFPSRRTCERLGGKLIDIVDIPASHPFYDQGERQKCRFRFDL